MSAPTRRMLLGAVPAAVAAAVATPAVSTEHPDADLLAALAAFDDLEKQIFEGYPKGCTHAQEEVWEAQIVPLRAAQGEMLNRICTIQAQTVAGVLARGRSLFAWGQGSWMSNPDDPTAYDDERLVTALVRDVNALAGEG